MPIASGAVAGRVSGRDARRDRFVGIVDQAGAGDVDAEGAAGGCPGVGDAVDRQRDDVAIVDVSADRACHGNGAGRLGGADDIVRCDRVEIDRSRSRSVERGRCAGAGGGIAGRVGGRDRDRDRTIIERRQVGRAGRADHRMGAVAERHRGGGVGIEAIDRVGDGSLLGVADQTVTDQHHKIAATVGSRSAHHCRHSCRSRLRRPTGWRQA